MLSEIKNKINVGNNKSFTYKFYQQNYDQKLPLVICFSDENEARQNTFVSDASQVKYPCFVLNIEYSSQENWNNKYFIKAIENFVFDLLDNYKIDEFRVYIVGAGTGAIGVWSMISAYPRLFASAIPISGCGDPYVVRNAKFLPIWAFHAVDDQKVPVSYKSRSGNCLYLAGSRRLVLSLRNSGSTAVRYTEYSSNSIDSPDNIWDKTFDSDVVWKWMFSQNRKSVLEIHYIKPGHFRIEDYFNSSAYLIEGKEKALLIDTGMGETDLLSVVKSLTRLPIEVAITHPHFDHIYHANKFDKIYLHKNDINNLGDYYHANSNLFIDKVLPSIEKFVPIEDGSFIDIGGVVFETVEFSGHTKNSVIFIDKANKVIYSGDAIGSGYIVLIICNESEMLQNITELYNSISLFKSRLPDFTDFSWFGGHFIQENSCDRRMQQDYLNGVSEYYNPISFEIILDLEMLCEKLIKCEISLNELAKSDNHQCEYKSAGIYFRITKEE